MTPSVEQVTFLLHFVSDNMRTWIIGDSIVTGAGYRQYQLPGCGQTWWHGKSGGKLGDVINMIHEDMYHNPYPTNLIIHMGTNDIFKKSTAEIRKELEEVLLTIRELLPFTTIIWSDILPRLSYSEEKNEGAGKNSTININKRAHKVCRQMLHGNTHVIKHSQVFNPRYRNVDGPVFRYDSTHLSPKGYDLFRKTVQNAMAYFSQNPEGFEYPVNYQ